MKYYNPNKRDVYRLYKDSLKYTIIFISRSYWSDIENTRLINSITQNDLSNKSDSIKYQLMDLVGLDMVYHGNILDKTIGLSISLKNPTILQTAAYHIDYLSKNSILKVTKK